MQRILFVYSRSSSFVQIDLDLLRERRQVDEREIARLRFNPFALLRAVWRSDLVFGWFAYWHTFLPITFAWLMRKPSVLIIGGYDTAADRRAGYGLQRGGPRQWLSRWTMRRATALITNSQFTRDEAIRNAGVSNAKITVVYHGVPDVFGEPVPSERERSALTVGVVDEANLVRKGLAPFARSSKLLSDVSFTVAGRDDGAAERLRALGGENLATTGWIGDEQLRDLYLSSSVYVQASTHEGFGMSVAEAMLAGCIPVTTLDGALPEVVGDTGIQIRSTDPNQIAAAIVEALAAAPDRRTRARRRVLEKFTIEARRDGLERVVEAALSQRS